MRYKLIDLWEGNAVFDEAKAKEAGIAGIIMRLNDIQGGLHLDENAYAQWKQSVAFLIRAWYFVYNPWVDGVTNANWFLRNALTDGCKRMFLDIEVIYSGITSKKYSSEVATCISILYDKGWKPAIYTGYGFLNLLSPWPTNVDYWWARYPYAMNPTIGTWAEMFKKADALRWEPDTMGSKKVAPAVVKLWQVSDKWKPEGSYNHAIDVNIFDGTLTDLLSWFAAPEVEIPEEPVPQWSALDLPTKVETLRESLITAGIMKR